MSDLFVLLREAAIDDWRVTETATASYELFFVHRNLETVRATDTLSTQVTVYVDHDGKRGDSSFAAYASATEEEIKEKLQAAARRARLVDNAPYTLPEGGELAVDLPTNMAEEDPQVLGGRIAQAVFAADTLPGGSINACEIFLYRDTLRVRSSRGVDKTQRTWRVMIEAIPTFTDANGSVELYEDYRFTEFVPEKVTAEIAARLRDVRDRAAAVKPQTPMTVNVVLRAQEIEQLMWELCRDADYAAVYSHRNLHAVGDDLQPGCQGDRLTVTLKSVIPGSEHSAYFDPDGLAMTDTCVLRDGVVASCFGSSRFGQYLGVEKPTGALRCLHLEGGSLTSEDLKAPYLECVSLSGLQLDRYSDYIGGEIRLARYFDGEKTVPVTGISMSARLSDVLRTLRLSANQCVEGGYEGPDKLLLRDVQVL